MAQTINSITSFLTEVYSDLSKIKASRGYQAIFANSGDMSRTEYVNNATQIVIDLIRGGKLHSKLLQRAEVEGELSLGGNVKHVKAQKFQNVAYDFPIIRDTGSVSYAEALKYRLAGQSDTDISQDVIAKSQTKLAEIVLSIMTQQMGRMEYQAAEALNTATCTLDDGGLYTFDRATGNTITVSVLWSVTATADPIGDFDIAIDKVAQSGKGSAKCAIMGNLALNAMLNTDQIKNFADNRRFEFVQMGSATKSLPGLPADMLYLEQNGFVYTAYIKTKKGRPMYIFTYPEQYESSVGTWADYAPSKDVLVFDHTARRDRYFGPQIRFDIMTADRIMLNRMFGLEAYSNSILNDQMSSDIWDARMWHHDLFMSESRTSISIETYTGPLFVPTAVDCTALLDGVIA